MDHVQLALSSNIASVGYDSAQQLLEVVFRSGAKYSYEAVPSGVANGLLNAPSAGRYFNTEIRNAFKCTKTT